MAMGNELTFTIQSGLKDGGDQEIWLLESLNKKKSQVLKDIYSPKT
jgi:hypothetical protein